MPESHSNQSVINRIKNIDIENYLSRGGKVGVSIWFDRLKDAKEFKEWLIERQELLQIKNDIRDLQQTQRAIEIVRKMK